MENIKESINLLINEVLNDVEVLWPKILWSLIILIIWLWIAYLSYLITKIIFKKIHLNDLIDKFKISKDSEVLKKDLKDNKNKIQKLTKNIKIDEAISKAFWYYIALIFLRISVSYMWITEVESFLKDLTNYLPSLFVWILIWFFGIRFWNFIYGITYHSLKLTKQKTAKVIASWSRIIIFFFTLMLVLDYTKIVSEQIINTILIWFIAMIALAWGLAFGLGWRDTAKEIIESLKK